MADEIYIAQSDTTTDESVHDSDAGRVTLVLSTEPKVPTNKQ